MSITITEIPDSNSCNETATMRTYTAAYRAFNSSGNLGPVGALAALTSAGKTIGSGYSFDGETDPSATMKTRVPKRLQESPDEQIIVCTWETPDSEENDEQDENGEPTTIPYEYYGLVETDDVIMQRVPEQAIIRGVHPGGQAIPAMPNGTKTRVCNSVGMIKDPPPMIDVPFTMLRMQKNFQTFNANIARLYKGSVNLDAFNVVSNFLGFAIRVDRYCGRLVRIAARNKFANGFYYWEVTTEILITPAGLTWRHLELDEGVYMIAWKGMNDGNSGSISSDDIATGRAEVLRIPDSHGNPVNKPVLLDGTGRPARAVAGKITPVFIEFSLYQELPWGAFIPNVWIP